MKRIYIADDEEDILLLLQCFLKKEGYHVEVFGTGEVLLERFQEEEADLLIVDIMMPGMDGFQVLSRIREVSEVPIIILTARDSDADLIMGFTRGCDDYFTKPFSPLKLTLRVNAVFSRMEEKRKEVLEYGDIRMYMQKKSALIGEKEVKLTGTEFSLLAYLISNADRAVSRDELLSNIWGYETEVETRVTDDVIKRLRKKMLALRSWVRIETVWGFGFMLKKDLEP